MCKKAAKWRLMVPTTRRSAIHTCNAADTTLGHVKKAAKRRLMGAHHAALSNPHLRTHCTQRTQNSELSGHVH
jgi:hypothetical protein